MGSLKNKKAMIEMIGLLFILFATTTGGTFVSKYTAGKVLTHAAEYQEGINLYADVAGAKNFYLDLLDGKLKTCVERQESDMANFAPIAIDTTILGECIVTNTNLDLANIQYKYKGYALPPLKVKTVEKSSETVTARIELETPLEMYPPGAKLQISVILNPVFVEQMACTGTGCEVGEPR